MPAAVQRKKHEDYLCISDTVSAAKVWRTRRNVRAAGLYAAVVKHKLVAHEVGAHFATEAAAAARQVLRSAISETVVCQVSAVLIHASRLAPSPSPQCERGKLHHMRRWPANRHLHTPASVACSASSALRCWLRSS